ncbi:NRDE family protein [Flavobacterium sp.]|uniref:NRDE family protein n=1 Tax=Flavobacterium sp. TaxID=239 RepID=UPI00286E99CF|nr:NRDE family protein [Flavobacterium sp.]
MCTVSFVNNNGKIILTSNRDEQVIRPNAIAPEFYTINDKKILFPKDAKGGGTWFAVAENGNTIVLLNGAKEKHQFKTNFYQKSRGLIVLDLICANNILENWDEINLEKVEPFTLVVYEKNQLFQLQWNEVEKDKINLDTSEKHIWSSSTLYSKKIREQRSNWFYDFFKIKNNISETDLYNFHSNTQTDDAENGLVINRNNHLKTISISQIVIQDKNVIFEYNDLIINNKTINSFQII